MKYRRDPGSIRGSVAALITPFDDDGAIDVEGLRSLIEWQLNQGSHAISLGGSTSEPTAMTLAERITSLGIAAEAVADRAPFLAGTGAGTLDETLELTAEAERLGADVALVVTPHYARPTQQGLYNWYSAVAREFPDLPLVVYNVPVRSAVDIDPETVARLRRDHANIVGIKDTTKDFEHFSDVLYLCGRDFLVWSGIESLCLPLLALGGVGFVSALTNITPKSIARMFDLWEAGEQAQARELHYSLVPLAKLLFVETNPTPAKWVLQQAGLIKSAKVRPPLCPLSAGGEEATRRLLAKSAATLAFEGITIDFTGAASRDGDLEPASASAAGLA